VGRVAVVLEKKLGAAKRQKEDILGCLIGCILSQNTTSINSGRAFERLRRTFPKWQMILRARPSRIAKAIEVGGLAKQKSIWIRDVVRWAHDRDPKLTLGFLRRMSDEAVIAELTALRGVGVKTASIVLCFALGRDVFPVDTHVHRICRRLGFVPPKSGRDQTFELMVPLVPNGKALSFHLNLIHHGREVCKAQRPRCAECIIRRFCVVADEAGGMV